MLVAKMEIDNRLTFRKRIAIFSFFFLFISIAMGQEQKDSLQIDSTEIFLRSFGLELTLGKSQPHFLPSLSPTKDSVLPSLRQIFTAPLPLRPWQLQENPDLQSIWQRELAIQNEYRTWYTIVGSVEVGAVAYLTYLQLKKIKFK
jgi:hypothetical protein